MIAELIFFNKMDGALETFYAATIQKFSQQDPVKSIKGNSPAGKFTEHHRNFKGSAQSFVSSWYETTSRKRFSTQYLTATFFSIPDISAVSVLIGLNGWVLLLVILFRKIDQTKNTSISQKVKFF